MKKIQKKWLFFYICSILLFKIPVDLPKAYGTAIKGSPQDPLSKPQRIVSCSLATDELLVALIPSKERSRIVALSSLAADKTYSNIPHIADQPLTTHPQMIKTPCHGTNIESLIAFKPDLVLLASYSAPPLKHQLDKNGIPFYQAPTPQNLDEIARTITSLAARLGEESEGQKLYDWFQAERKNIASIPIPQTLKKRKVIHLFDDGTLSGRNTIFDALTQEIPVTNQAAQMGLVGWSKHSIETLLTLNPDTLVIGGDPNENKELALKRLKNIPGVNMLKQISSKRLIILSEHEFGTVSHHIVKGLRRLKEELIRIESI